MVFIDFWVYLAYAGAFQIDLSQGSLSDLGRCGGIPHASLSSPRPQMAVWPLDSFSGPVAMIQVLEFQ